MRRLWMIALAIAVITVPALAKTSKAPPIAPPFTLAGLNGSVVLDSLRGRTVLLDFWASWCGPCRHSFPWMNDFQRRYASKGLTIVAVNLDKDRELAKGFLAEVPAEFTVAFDPSGKTAESYGVKAMPTTLVISPEGRIVATHTGFDPKKTAEFEALIAGALPK